jgi:hypothetical protein
MTRRGILTLFDSKTQVNTFGVQAASTKPFSAFSQTSARNEKPNQKNPPRSTKKSPLCKPITTLRRQNLRPDHVKNSTPWSTSPTGNTEPSAPGPSWITGIELPNSYWEITDKFWRLTQKADGIWPYASDPGVVVKEEHPALSVAGIASLYVSQEFVDTQLRSIPKPDKNIDLGLAWLNKNFKAGTQALYYMYGVERVGLSSGLKFFGTTDWYKEGAAAMLQYQNADGVFDGKFTGAEPVVSTAYGLLFLARGRNPIVFNKLNTTAHGTPARAIPPTPPAGCPTNASRNPSTGRSSISRSTPTNGSTHPSSSSPARLIPSSPRTTSPS